MKSYRPSCFWFEPIDMLRKLALSGALQFFSRGSSAQVMVGCMVSFCSFGLQVKVAPYEEPESNLLKMLVDFQIFVTFLVCFILHVLRLPHSESSEPIDAEQYGEILVVMWVGFIIVAAGLSAAQFY